MGSASLRVTDSTGTVADELAGELEAIPGVSATAAIIHQQCALKAAPTPHVHILGLDLLGANESLSQLANDVVEVNDELEFVASPDSVVVPSSWLANDGYSLGDTLTLMTADGPVPLVIRGAITSTELSGLFGGQVLLMDLPAAQMLFRYDRRVDYVDVWTDDGADREQVQSRVAAALAGRGFVDNATGLARRATELLFALRVFLLMSGFVAVVVGFFIVYNTVSTNLRQRSQSIGLLHALGVPRLRILAWLLGESAVVALIGLVLGIGLGRGFAAIALPGFSATASAWIEHATSSIALSWQTMVLAVVCSLGVSFLATLMCWKRVLSSAPGWNSSGSFTHLRANSNTRPTVLFAALYTGAAGLLILAAPRTLPYAQLVTYLLTVVGLLMLAFGVLAPVSASLVARWGGGVASRFRGFGLINALANIGRDHQGLVIVASAIVMAIGATLATSTVTRSLEYSAMDWMDQHYSSDLVIGPKGSFLQILTASTISPEVIDETRNISGVSQVQGVRVVETELRGHPVVMLALDDSPEGMDLIDAAWSDVGPDFLSGNGVLVSDNLAYRHSISRGDTISLRSPAGLQHFHVLGLFPDYLNSLQLGAVAIARSHYRKIWRDDRITRVQVWIRGHGDDQRRAIIETLRRQVADPRGMDITTLDEARAALQDLIERAFSSVYAMVAIALLVSFSGVLNFLLMAIADRSSEILVLRANGLSAGQIVATVMIEGGIVGLLAGVLGTLAGLVVSLVIVRHSVPMVTGWFFDFHFPLAPALRVFVGTIVLAVFAGVPPGIQALRESARARGQT